MIIKRKTRSVSTALVAIIVIVIVIIAAVGLYFATTSSTSKSSSSSSAISGSSSTTVVTSTSQTSPTSSTSGPLVPVNIAVEASIYWEPLYIANSTGIFEKYGIQPKLTTYQSDSAIMTAVGAGQADYSVELPQIIANAVDSGVNAKALAAVFTQFTEGAALLVTANSSITTVQQLQGQKVGVSAKGSLTDLLAEMVMKKYGITFTEVSLGFTARVPALLAGQVQAIMSFDPQAYTLLKQKQVRSILDPIVFNASFVPYAVAFASGSLIQSNPTVAQNLLKATFAAIAYMRANATQSYPVLAAIGAGSIDVGQRLYNDTISYFSTNGQFNTTMMLQNIALQNQLVGSNRTIRISKTLPILVTQ